MAVPLSARSNVTSASQLTSFECLKRVPTQKSRLPPALRKMLEPEVVKSMLSRLDASTRARLGVDGQNREYERECALLFRKYDLDDTGGLDGDELMAAVLEAIPENFRETIGAYGPYLKDVILAFDKNGDGVIQKAEFFKFCTWVLAMSIMCYFDMPAFKDTCDECQLSFHEELQPDPYDPAYYYCKNCWDHYAGSFRAVYEQLDVDASGRVSVHELRSAIVGLQLEDQEVVELVDQMDSDHDGYISFGEWVQHMSLRLRKALLQCVGSDGKLRGFSVFHLYALDGHGELTLREVALLCKALGLPEDQVATLMNKMDSDNSGTVSLAEWLSKMPHEIENGLREKLGLHRPDEVIGMTKSGKYTTETTVTDEKREDAVKKQLGQYKLQQSRGAAMVSFQYFDKDGDGTLDANELKSALSRIGVKEAPEGLAGMDVDKDGRVSMDEWLKRLPTGAGQRLYMQVCGKEAREMTAALVEAFKKLDVDQDGRVPKRELANMLEGALVGKDSLEVLHSLDSDMDGYVDLNEWLTGMNSVQERVGR